jgi:hypothetical protein
LRTAPTRDYLPVQGRAGEYRVVTRGCGAPKARMATCRSAPSPPGNHSSQASMWVCGGSPHLLRIRRARHAGRAPSLRKTPGAAIIARHASSWRRPTERRRLRGHTPWMSSAMNALTGRLVGGVAAWWRRRSGPGPTEASPPALDHLHMPPLQFASRSALTRLPRDRSASARQGMQHARASHCPR